VLGKLPAALAHLSDLQYRKAALQRIIRAPG
jgi:hypothetical protein